MSKPTKRIGRPKKAPDKTVEAAILDRLAEGKSLRAACSAPGMPTHSMVLAWLEDPDRVAFADQYARARRIGYLVRADEIADKAAAPLGADDSAVAVARARLEVDTLRWELSKMLPKIYGEKIAVTGEGGGPLTMLLGQLGKSSVPVANDDPA